MKDRILFWATISALILASCDKNETTIPAEPEDPSGRVAVQFTGTSFDVSPASTRAENPWTYPGSIGIFALADETTDIMDGYSNVTYTYNALQNSFFPAAETIYFPVDGSKRRFAAYYPCQELEGTCYKIDLTEQPSLNGQASFELLWTGVTEAYNKEQPNVALNFGHQYAQISVKVKNGTGIDRDDLKRITVAMTDMHLTADFDVLTGAMTPTGNPGSLTFWRNADGSGQYALVLPTEVNADRVINFTLGEDTFRWAIGDKKFEKGKTYDYTVTVSRTPLGLTATVIGWEEGGSDSGVAE